MISSRRQFLSAAGQAGIGLTMALVVPGQAASAADAACYDPSALPLSQRNRRRSLGYVDATADPARRCGLCAFFTGTADGCGTCQMLTGGTVNAGGLCNSFAPRPKA